MPKIDCEELQKNIRKFAADLAAKRAIENEKLKDPRAEIQPDSRYLGPHGKVYLNGRYRSPTF